METDFRNPHPQQEKCSVSSETLEASKLIILYDEVNKTIEVDIIKLKSRGNGQEIK